VNTVGEEKFLAWYKANAKKPLSIDRVLKLVYDCYFETGSEVFALSPSETKSGEAADYPFRAENIGCCGASTLYFYF